MHPNNIFFLIVALILSLIETTIFFLLDKTYPYIINIVGFSFLIIFFFGLRRKFDDFFNQNIIKFIDSNPIIKYEFAQNKKKLITYFCFTCLMAFTPYEFVFKKFNIFSFLGIWVVLLLISFSLIVMTFHFILQYKYFLSLRDN